MTGPVAEPPPVRVRRRRKDTRTADGDGSLYFDKQAQLWRGELMVGYRPDPNDPARRRRDVRKVAARTQAECRRRLQALRQEHAAGLLPRQAKGATVAAFLTRWLDATGGALRPRTVERYRQIVRTHLAPAFGRTRLRELRPDQLQRLYAEKTAAGLAPRTVHHVHAVLHNALEQALRWGEVPRNVADAASPPQAPLSERRALTGEEAGALLAAAERYDDRLRALWALACHTGCRQGELLALGWDAVDLDGGGGWTSGACSSACAAGPARTANRRHGAAGARCR